MKEAIFKIIDKFAEGVDTYHNNGSMWLIFTDEKKWVIELTEDGTLWYNYYFFQDCFKYVSLDVVENQHFITEWFDNTIQNGVKETRYDATGNPSHFKDVIKDGIKETNHCSVSNDENARMALQNGIKVTKGLGPSEVTEKEINRVIKEIHDDVYHNNGRVQGVINNGIKETIELPDKSGELNGYGEYYARQKNKTYPHTDIVNDVVNDGIKETKYCELHSLMRADHIIRDGIKETKRWMRFKRDVTPIIETNWRKVDNHPTYLDNIIDESNCSSK